MSGVNTTDELISWICRRNQEVAVSVEQAPFRDIRGWHFDDTTGNLEHESGRFFSVCGLDVMTNIGVVSHWTQPIINQPEVGYFGIF